MSEEQGRNQFEKVDKAIKQLTESAMSDTMGLHMQNAITIQQSTQTISNAATSTACALILKKASS